MKNKTKASSVLFLSHAGSDSKAALELKKRIENSPEAKKQKLKVWIDKHDLEAGKPWVDQLESAINEESTAFGILLTKSGAKNWIHMEVRLALIRVVEAQRKNKHYPFIPIIVDDTLDIARLPPFAQLYQGICISKPNGIQELIVCLKINT